MILSENYLLRQIDNEYVILPVGQKIANGEKVYRLNQSTYTILTELMEEKTLEQLLERLYTLYEITPTEIPQFRGIVEDFVTKMTKMGIILTNL